MQRGTKEFYEIQHQFEMACRSPVMAYLPADFTKDESSKFAFYANGEVNAAFRAFFAGYSAGRCNYMTSQAAS